MWRNLNLGSRDSFLQAMKNLRDSGQAKPEEEEVQTNVAQEESVPAVIPEPEAESEVHTEDYGYENQSETSSVNSFYGDVYAQPASKTVISKDTSIVGEIHSTSDVEISGNLKGNVETSGDIKLCGKIIGDIMGNNIDLIAGEVQGNIIAAATLTIDSDSVVVGDTTANNILMDGKQKGNMQIENMADFQSNALLKGNVTTGRLSISEGAKLRGAIQVKIDDTEEDLFDEPISVAPIAAEPAVETPVAKNQQ